MVSTASGPRNAGPCHAAIGRVGVALLLLLLLLLHRLLEVLPPLLLLRQPPLLLNRLESMLPLPFSVTDECMLAGDASAERIRRAKLRLGLNSCGAMPRRQFPGVLSRTPHGNPVSTLRG